MYKNVSSYPLDNPMSTKQRILPTAGSPDGQTQIRPLPLPNSTFYYIRQCQIRPSLNKDPSISVHYLINRSKLYGLMILNPIQFFFGMHFDPSGDPTSQCKLSPRASARPTSDRKQNDANLVASFRGAFKYIKYIMLLPILFIFNI